MVTQEGLERQTIKLEKKTVQSSFSCQAEFVTASSLLLPWYCTKVLADCCHSKHIDRTHLIAICYQCQTVLEHQITRFIILPSTTHHRVCCNRNVMSRFITCTLCIKAGKRPLAPLAQKDLVKP